MDESSTMESIVRSFVFIFFFLSANMVFANSCKNIDCDCDAISNKALSGACKKQESWLKAQCKHGKPRNFCGAHGLDGSPLALRIQEDNAIEPLKIEKIQEEHKKVATMYWAIHSDSGDVLKYINKQDFQSAKTSLKSIESYLNNLFKIQQAVTISWHHHKMPEKAIEAWSYYAKDTFKVAQSLSSLANKIQQKQNANASLELNTLMVLSLNLSGYAYELAGLSYGKLNKNKQAASAWQKASRLSHQQARYYQNVSNGEFSRLLQQAAARLHRANLHWSVFNARLIKTKEKTKSSISNRHRVHLFAQAL